GSSRAGRQQPGEAHEHGCRVHRHRRAEPSGPCGKGGGSGMNPTPSASGFWLRLLALTHKEFRQMVRDRSNLAIGIGLPIVLILLFGYGLSLDVKNSPVAIVMED